MIAAIQRLLKSNPTANGQQDSEALLWAAGKLHCFDAMELLIDLALSKHEFAAAAGQVVVTLCGQLAIARNRPGADSGSARRRRTLERLRGAEAEFTASGIQTGTSLTPDWVVQSLLALSHWGDGSLQQLLGSGDEVARAIQQQLRQSNCDAVVALVAGLPHRSTAPAELLDAWRTRNDATLADAIEREVGPRPSGKLIRRLRELGRPACLRPLDFAEPPPSVRDNEIELAIARWRMWGAFVETEHDAVEALHWGVRCSTSGDPTTNRHRRKAL